MTNDELKQAIRDGRATPGISQELFESAWGEVVREDYPKSRIVTLSESRQSNNDFSPDVYARVAAMIDGASPTPDSQGCTLSDSRPVLDPPQTEENVLRTLHEAA